MVCKQASIACVKPVYEFQIFTPSSQASLRNSQCYWNPIAVICMQFTCMSLSSFQNHFVSVHFLIILNTSICVRTCEEPCVEKLHRIPMKFRKKKTDFISSMKKKLTLFKECIVWLDSPCEVSITNKLARQHAVCLSNNGRITDSRNLFECSQIVGTCFL